jgi:hypothetical protein
MPLSISHVTRRCVLTAILVLASQFSLNAPASPLESAPSAQYIPIQIRSSQFAESAAFKGSGLRQFEYHVSAIQPEPSSQSALSGPPKTGVVYTLPSPISDSMLLWEPTDGGFAYRVRIIADQAKSLRLHLLFDDQSPSLELRVQGNKDDIVLGPILGTAVRDRELWLPVTTGEEAVLEVFIPTGDAVPNVRFQIDQINYIYGVTLPNRPLSTGAADYKEYDVTCYSNYSNYTAIQNAAAATAKIMFISGGSSYVCSGTLLNDKKSTTTPWFATANHCVPNQTVANTVTFFWRYEATSCGSSSTDSRYRQTSGGGQLLWTDATYDAAFLKLNSPPGPYTYFAGWDANSFAIGDTVYGVHHPAGDHTMVSVGSITALDQPTTSADTGNTLVLNDVKYTYGGVEGGSSGSGVFRSAGSYLAWKGALFGGPGTNYQIAGYGPFEYFYSNVKQYLAPPPMPGSAAVTQFASRATLTPLNTVYGAFALTNATKLYIAVRGPSLGTLGVSANPHPHPKLNLYSGSGTLLASANQCSSSNPDSAAVLLYYQNRGAPLSANDACLGYVNSTLPAGVYTFQIVPDASTPTGSGEVLFETTPTGAGAAVTQFASRATLTPSGTVYGAFALVNPSNLYIAVRGPSLGTLGVSANPHPHPKLNLFNASGTLLVSNNVCVGTSSEAAAVLSYYQSRSQPLNANDPCVGYSTNTLAAGVYTFQIVPDPTAPTSSGEVLFETTPLQ